jgi:hypothetical protein
VIVWDSLLQQLEPLEHLRQQQQPLRQCQQQLAQRHGIGVQPSERPARLLVVSEELYGPAEQTPKQAAGLVTH